MTKPRNASIDRIRVLMPVADGGGGGGASAAAVTFVTSSARPFVLNRYGHLTPEVADVPGGAPGTSQSSRSYTEQPA